MSMAKMNNRASKMTHSTQPTYLRSQSKDEADATAAQPEAPATAAAGSDDATAAAPMDTAVTGEKDNPLPEPEETSQQAIPTPELLFLRRATKHMPITSLSGEHGMSPPTSPKPGGLSKRRSTVNPKGLLAPEESPAFPQVFESEGIPDYLQKNIAKRRSTLQVPSKLAM